jgi:hypothetical protein
MNHPAGTLMNHPAGKLIRLGCIVVSASLLFQGEYENLMPPSRREFDPSRMNFCFNNSHELGRECHT